MFSLTTIIFGLAMIVILIFWLLFFFVVKVRIADKNLVVHETSRFGFLFTQWPHDEMRAYLASLDPDENRRLINRFLRHAKIVFLALFSTYAFLLIVIMVTGGKL